MKITKTQLKQIIKEELAKIYEITGQQKAHHDSLVNQALELLNRSKQTDDVNEKEVLMQDARKLLDRATAITTQASDELG